MSQTISNDLTVSNMSSENPKEEPESEKKEAPTEISSGNYSTGFCTTTESCTKKVTLIVFACLSVFLIGMIIYHYDKWKPFTFGIMRMFKVFILYSLVIGTMAFFVKMMGFLYWWIETFKYCWVRMVDPLEDLVARSWYWYFTDLLNWLIWLGYFLFYLLCCIGLCLLLVLVLLPTIACTGFLIGYLYSLMGEDDRIKPKTMPGSNESLFSKAMGAMSGKLGGVTGLAKGAMAGPDVTGLAKGAMAGPDIAEMAKGVMSNPDIADMAKGAMSGKLGNVAGIASSVMKTPGLTSLAKKALTGKASMENVTGFASNVMKNPKVADLAKGVMSNPAIAEMAKGTMNPLIKSRV